MAYDSDKLLRAKIFWYFFKVAGYSLSRAICDLNDIRGALNGKNLLNNAQSLWLTHATAKQYSEEELANAVALYERVTDGKYSDDIVSVLLGIKEKEG